jgi:hypothetical protein
VEQGLTTEEAGSLGEIRVELHYRRAILPIENPLLDLDMHHINKISEKALKGKAVSHATRYFVYLSIYIVSFLQTFRLGESEVARQPRVFRADYVYDRNKPFATFKFKYRSLGTPSMLSTNICPLTTISDALKASCIIPRSPTLESLDDRPESDLNTDELRELLRRERVCCNPQNFNVAS